MINCSNSIGNLWLILTYFETLLCDIHQHQQDGKTIYITQPPGKVQLDIKGTLCIEGLIIANCLFPTGVGNKACL